MASVFALQHIVLGETTVIEKVALEELFDNSLRQNAKFRFELLAEARHSVISGSQELQRSEVDLIHALL